MEAETSLPIFTFKKIVPQTEQILSTAVKAEPSAGQMQGTLLDSQKVLPFCYPQQFFGQ